MYQRPFLIQENRLNNIKESKQIDIKPKPIKPVYRKVSNSVESENNTQVINGPAGAKAVVGKNAKMNETLRSKWAKKNRFLVSCCQ